MKDKAAHPELQRFVCERLRKLGYYSARTIRLYGEELHLISDPRPAREWLHCRRLGCTVDDRQACSDSVVGDHHGRAGDQAGESLPVAA